ncbi:MAG TPA: kelch repeat-containing protein [Polyangiaceae bacterium]|nr:kelch repeat-containing protein [Polyangiaceae bacterium]
MKHDAGRRDTKVRRVTMPRGLAAWGGLLGVLALGCPIGGAEGEGGQTAGDPGRPYGRGDGTGGTGGGWVPSAPDVPPWGQGGAGPAWPGGGPSFEGIPFETPTWFPAGGRTPPAPRADAGLTFYGGEQNCAVLFGGFDVGPAGRRFRNDVAVRCGGEWQLGVGGGVAGSVPAPRQGVAFAYAPFAEAGKAGAYLFGGKGPEVWGDFWRLELNSLPNGTRRLSWARVTPPEPQTEANWPSPRAGAALSWTGDGLLLFGGTGPGGELRDDTWRFDGTTWVRLCAGEGSCFARRGFAAMPVSFGAVAQAMSFGGADPTAPFPWGSGDVLSFTGAGWSSTHFSSARWATDEKGLYEPGAYVMPGARLFAWAAMTAGGQTLIGSGDRARGLERAKADLWRIETREKGVSWARVPVGDAVPGPRVGASAVYDPVRKETLVVGGALSAEALDDGAPLLNPAPPVAYRGQVGTASATVACLGLDADGDCTRYRLEARVSLPEGAPSSRARAYVARQNGLTMSPAAPECGLPGAPIAPDDDGVVRCEAEGQLAASYFVVHLQDSAYARGGALCSDAPTPNRPFCNDADAYPRLFGCPAYLTPESGIIDCE